MNKTSVILLVLIGLLGVSSLALAEHDNTHREDTLISIGYDDLNHFLAINIGPNDAAYECDFENETLTATYGAETGGIIGVDDLVDDKNATKSFDPRALEKLGDPDDLETNPVDYTGIEGECAVHGVVVAGPNGQINHGQWMKAAKTLFSLLDIKSGGCVMRHLAKSNIGKGNDPTHLTVSEAEASASVFGGVGTIGDIDFTSEEVDCNRGKKDKGTAAGVGSAPAKGKSADAPGHNK